MAALEALVGHVGTLVATNAALSARVLGQEPVRQAPAAAAPAAPPQAVKAPAKPAPAKPVSSCGFCRSGRCSLHGASRPQAVKAPSPAPVEAPQANTATAERPSPAPAPAPAPSPSPRFWTPADYAYDAAVSLAEERLDRFVALGRGTRYRGFDGRQVIRFPGVPGKAVRAHVTAAGYRYNFRSQEWTSVA